ncbi:unnamed protein product [Moneuplotes crassus]|uniref:Uncharacterized protein n=1 Tax=Euplotes crassus TaxID=5936 RepID=A0AAD1U9T6_EUPCR|nr:unnamed protein product [Moneuplotes crassus]
MKKIASYIGNSIRKADLFPQKVSLTYRGKPFFQTLGGGLLSMIITVIVIGYSARLFMIMIEKEDTAKALNTVFIDLQSYGQSYELNNDTFQFPFTSLDTSTGEFYFDPSYITVSISQETNYYDLKIGARSSQEEVRPFSLCGGRFPTVNENFNDTRNILMQTAQCPLNNSFSVQGSYFSEIYKQVTMTVSKCNNSTS